MVSVPFIVVVSSITDGRLMRGIPEGTKKVVVNILLIPPMLVVTTWLVGEAERDIGKSTVVEVPSITVETLIV